MTNTRTLTTHICTLSFCKLLLEVNGDTINIQFMDLPGQLPIDKLLRMFTASDAVNLIYFVFHRDRLGTEFSQLFFEWKDTVELRRVYENKPDLDQKSQARLLQYLHITSIRYIKIIGSLCRATDYELLVFFELLEVAILSQDLP